MMPKIALIQPLWENRDLDRNIKTLYPLGLSYVAAYVPEHWDVVIIDEQVEKVDLDMDVDLVGLTSTTLSVNRAYILSKEFQKRGKKVIIGGVHASLCPEEAKKFCDSVVIGDAEGIMHQLIKDFENNKLKKEYKGTLSELNDLKMPRRDLFSAKYTFLPVNTSRGCPFNCNFCAIHNFYGGKYRTREVEHVIAELKTLPKGYETVFFTDGNMYGYSKNDITRFKNICRRIAEERKKGTIPFKQFSCYASVNALDDEEALDLAAAAGCITLLVGFESINPDSLKDMNKTLNLKYGADSYKKLVHNAQKRKILVVGEMIVGNDHDDMQTLLETEEFLDDINFDALRLQILQPIPGTKLFESLQKEGRLLLKKFPEDWRKIENDFVLGVHFIPKRLTADQLKQWVKKTGMDFYKPMRVLKRAMRNFMITRSLKFALTTILMNYKSRKSYANAKI